jgi:hypothetical protein
VPFNSFAEYAPEPNPATGKGTWCGSRSTKTGRYDGVGVVQLDDRELARRFGSSDLVEIASNTSSNDARPRRFIMHRHGAGWDGVLFDEPVG